MFQKYFFTYHNCFKLFCNLSYGPMYWDMWYKHLIKIIKLLKMSKTLLDHVIPISPLAVLSTPVKKNSRVKTSEQIAQQIELRRKKLDEIKQRKTKREQKKQALAAIIKDVVDKIEDSKLVPGEISFNFKDDTFKMIINFKRISD